MTGEASGTGRDDLRWLCWLPLLLLVGLELYVRRFDGWGAWAAAPLLLLPGILSLAVTGLGVWRCVSVRREPAAARARLYTAIAALPLAWLSVRRFLV